MSANSNLRTPKQNRASLPKLIKSLESSYGEFRNLAGDIDGTKCELTLIGYQLRCAIDALKEIHERQDKPSTKKPAKAGFFMPGE